MMRTPSAYRAAFCWLHPAATRARALSAAPGTKCAQAAAHAPREATRELDDARFGTGTMK